MKMKTYEDRDEGCWIMRIWDCNVGILYPLLDMRLRAVK
jgi:hypothetical protein